MKRCIHGIDIEFYDCKTCAEKPGALREVDTLGNPLRTLMTPHPQPQVTPELDPHGISPHTPGAKLDSGKIRPWLCISGFSRALAAVAEVTSQGAIKYTPNGWMSVPDGESRYMDAFARHALALGRGETVDPDTGCLHRAQMIWNLLAALELGLRDEEKQMTAAEVLARQRWRGPI